jgi:membrane-associated phospholipid phosphatase
VKVIIVFLLIMQSLFGWQLDQKVQKDDSAFWAAHYDVPRYFTYTAFAITLLEGSKSRLGVTSWKSLEAGLISQILAEGTKRATQRTRPRYTDDPNSWGEGGDSFFSGHVSGMAAIVTPYILEYRDDYPLMDLLWLTIPYQMVGRVKEQAHWQSDVLVGAIVGVAVGYWVHTFDYPLSLYFTDDKVVAGLRYQF